jgi:hypothetical protein
MLYNGHDICLLTQSMDVDLMYMEIQRGHVMRILNLPRITIIVSFLLDRNAEMFKIIIIVNKMLSFNTT